MTRCVRFVFLLGGLGAADETACLCSKLRCTQRKTGRQNTQINLTPPNAQAVPLLEFESDAPCTAAAFCPPANDDAAGGDGGGDADVGGDGVADGFNTPQSPLPRLAAGYADGSIRLFDLSNRVILWSVTRHPSPVVALCWHPAQPLLMSASR